MRAVTKTNSEINDTQDLRRYLLNTMIDVAQGNIEPQKAKVICNISQQVYNITKLEVMVATAKQDIGVSKFPALPLK